MQRAYWTHNAEEQASLEAGFDMLSWQEKLRLHHLYCLERIHPAAGPGAATQNCLLTLRLLMAADSPYRPRQALIWQGVPGSQTGRHPNLLGMLQNPPITYLGCLEVYRLDAAQSRCAWILSVSSGLTWAIGNEHDRQARMTRSVTQNEVAIAGGLEQAPVSRISVSAAGRAA
jgi:hypothetical protein